MPTQKKRRIRPADLEDRQPFARFPWWLRLVSSLPLPAWYRIADFFAFLAEYVIRYRRAVVDAQLLRCFPDLTAAELARHRRDFYQNFADVTVEILKSVTISEDEIHRRMTLLGLEPLRAELAAGHSVIVVTSHTCNWEWTLLSLTRGIGAEVDAAYKPLHGRWGDRLFLTIRSRFGARMIPAKRLLMRILRNRKRARVVAMVADQDPVSATARHFSPFFGIDTAFYVGPEAIARVGKMSVYYLAVRRVARGHYTVTFDPLATWGEELAEGALVERYARRVEAMIRERPSDWLWSYRRWKVRRNPPPAGTGTGA